MNPLLLSPKSSIAVKGITENYNSENDHTYDVGCSIEVNGKEVEIVEENHLISETNTDMSRQGNVLRDMQMPSDKPACPNQKRRDSFNDGSSSPATPNSATKRSKISESVRKRHEEARQKRLLEMERKKAEKEAAMQRIKEEKDRKKEEEKKKKDEEKRQKEKKKQEIEEQRKIKEAEKAAKEAEKAQLKQQKEEERRKIEEQKIAEKKAKDDAKKAIEDEKRKLQQAEQDKLQKSQNLLKSFFYKKEMPSVKESSEIDRLENFMVPENTALAPTHRAPMLENDKKIDFDRILEKSHDITQLYLVQLKAKLHKPQTSLKTDYHWLNNNEVEIEGTDSLMHVKYLHFNENVRPPYYGTWRKRSKQITARCPFGKYQDFDYEEDSEAEWDEGDDEEGDECLSERSEEPDDEILPDEENLDDEGNPFYVPHGFLGDDELRDRDDFDEIDANVRRERIAAAAEAWKKSHSNKKMMRLKPIIIGPSYPTINGNVDQCMPSSAVELLTEHKSYIVDNPMTAYNYNSEEADSDYEQSEPDIKCAKKNDDVTTNSDDDDAVTSSDAATSMTHE